MIHFGTTELLVGLIQGLAYALLGVGLVLIYRATRVIHFGYGEIGAFGALALAKLVLDEHWSWWIAMPVMVLSGALIGCAWELIVVRPLSKASRLIVMVGTIAIAQLMFIFQLVIPEIHNRQAYPTAIDYHQPIGSFVLRGEHLAVLAVTPIIAIALTWFLGRTKYGLAIRASAANTDAASLAGVKVKLLSTLVWGLGGALSTLTFILLFPVRGVTLTGSTPVLGPSLLLRAFLVALVGRLVSLPLAVAGGIGFGLIESGLYANVAPNTVELVIFLLLISLLTLRGAATSSDDGASIAGRVRTVPARFAELGLTRALRVGVPALTLITALVVPWVQTDPSKQFAYAKVLVYVIIVMSVTVITGWAGQLSLCQFAFVGLGAFSTAGLTDRGMPFFWAGVCAVVLTTLAAVVVGFPALRLKGLLLAIITLGFAQATGTWLLTRSVFHSASADTDALVTRGPLGPFDLTNQRTYYYFCLVITVAVAVGLTQLRRSGVGRAIIAVRENESAASSATLSPALAKLTAFAVSGAVAGIGGALFGGLLVQLRATDFAAQQSISVLVIGIVGGVGSIVGAILGTLYLIGLPNVVGANNIVTLLLGGIGLLGLVLFAPGGLLELAQRARDALLERALARKPAETVEDELASAAENDGLEPAPHAAARIASVRIGPRGMASPPEVPALVCRDVEVRFGGLIANQNVSLTVGQGETVGLIGTNGAGKSTLMNAVGGYTRTSGGSIEVFGVDVTGWAAHDRARLGIGRVFQDARLYGELTVRECVLVAMEARQRSEFVPCLLGLPPAVHSERIKRSVATDLLDLTGLGRYADAFVAELSTGTRRIAELACLIAGGSRLLLLDEPTGGVAQKEVEAFGAVIKQVQQQLEASILLIEHDMPLVMSLSDRIVCMSSGAVIAAGSPDEIRHDPDVIAAYLGTDDRAIERSDAVAGAPRG
jgi:ABC-type branched-subunit amino acid transport system ATPase component/ABC-type branched-subunit amino acid transport system permease subunit